MNLFDIIDREEAKECKHLKERKDEAVWPDRPDLNGPRMVWICEACGRMRGRFSAII